MGEGITVGMDGMKRATIVGTEMARLAGATSHITLPNTKIGVNFPTEKLFNVNGIPRENFVPAVHVDMLRRDIEDDGDIILLTGQRVLRNKTKHQH